MAKNKTQSKKKKGPKGKKARAKAKLDRQWGESVDEEEAKQSRVRRGRSRLLPKGQQKKNAVNQETSFAERATTTLAQSHSHFSDQEETSSSEESDVEDTTMMHENPLGQLLRDIHNNKSKRKQEMGDAIDGSEEESVSSSGEMEQDGDESSNEETDEADSVASESDRDDDMMDNNQADDSNKFSSVDPFSFHFNKEPLPENEAELSRLVKSIQDDKNIPTRRLNPALELSLSSGRTRDELSSSGFLLEPESNIPLSAVENKWNEMTMDSFQSWCRKVLRQNWKKFNKSARRHNADSGGDEKSTGNQQFSFLQQCLYPSLTSYADMLITAETRENRQAISNLLVLHILNHVLTSRGRTQRHNRKLKDLKEKADTDETIQNKTLECDDKFRDQGYTRPKVLIILPTRGTCLSLMRRMISLLGEAGRVQDMERFEAEYGAPPLDDEEEDDDPRARARRKSVLEAKGQEWNELFGDDVNDDDDFKIGMALNPNAVGVSKGSKGGGVSVKLYSEFYKSDIIMASPLGVKMSVSSSDHEEDVDFLSSIEICLVGHANVLLMQNWDHVNEIMRFLNRQPKKNNDTDFSRVRNYLLAGQAQNWRQLIISSTLSDPYILSTFKRNSKSIGGRLKMRRMVPSDEASLCDVLVKVNQVFQRVPCNSFATVGKDRLKYFQDRVLPQILRLKQKHTLIFIPSYFDFVSVRNLLLRQEAEFVSVSEYARVSEVSRGRARFLQGRKPIMLYTGRCHFFSRHAIKGARHVVFFGLPEHAEFYPELLNVLNKGLGGTEGDVVNTLDLEAPPGCLVLFTKYDSHALERIVGSQNCDRMLQANKGTFMFSS